nr:MAG TPA: hypothetical protein [Caudoviricetes sp.]DAJ19964.1 MAG TPA: hypothetical protein [Myoviridae sp. ctiIS8]DAK83038.1 MAG TPA: hypothetical protein [Caudoviricetes sp.]
MLYLPLDRLNNGTGQPFSLPYPKSRIWAGYQPYNANKVQ